jgi:GTP cyclohydrolase IV
MAGKYQARYEGDRCCTTARLLECFVDLGPQQKGAHMSRFEEIVNEAIDEDVPSPQKP